MRGPYADTESEFWYNVMPQADMPLAGDIGADFDVDRVAKFLTEAANQNSDTFAQTLQNALAVDPSIFNDLRQLLGVSDKRAYLELSYLASRAKPASTDTGLCGCYPWNMARHPLDFFLRLARPGSNETTRGAAVEVLSKYLLQVGLAEAASGFVGLSSTQLTTIYRMLVLPRETQQKAAKRRGHGCEGALAQVLHSCGVSVVPTDKHANPMGAKDPNLDQKTLLLAPKKQGATYSFDMLVLENQVVRVAVQSLIHTSDPGQYGVNKSDETVAVAKQIKLTNHSTRKKQPLELWGLLDGIGFSENKPDTINKMLRYFDYFVQLNTLYKAPLRLHALGLCVVKAIQFSDIYTPDDVSAIVSKYVPSGVMVMEPGHQPPTASKAVEAGRATLYL